MGLVNRRTWSILFQCYGAELPRQELFAESLFMKLALTACWHRRKNCNKTFRAGGRTLSHLSLTTLWITNKMLAYEIILFNSLQLTSLSNSQLLIDEKKILSQHSFYHKAFIRIPTSTKISVTEVNSFMNLLEKALQQNLVNSHSWLEDPLYISEFCELVRTQIHKKA